VRTAEASAEVDAPVENVFGFLADLGNHWRLASRWIEVVTLDRAGERADRATVRLSGPLGLARTVQTRVDSVTPPSAIRGHGTSGRTHASVSWTLTPGSQATRVSVEVRLIRASLADRVIWLCFGRAWLARRLQLTVSGLDDVLDALAAAV
jgi:Polyketide cyclase / dehydrase and lipid transport